MLGQCVELDPDDGAVVLGVVVLGVVVVLGIVAVDDEPVDVDDEPPDAAYAAVPPTSAALAASPARAVRNRLSIRITSLPSEFAVVSNDSGGAVLERPGTGLRVR
jgi:hypothetical protein